MRILLTVLVFLMSFAPAYAATQRIDVTGAFHTAQVNGAVDLSTWDNVNVGPYDTSEPDFAEFTMASFFSGNTGSALFDGQSYSDCAGLLFALCWGYAHPARDAMFAAADYGTTFRLSETTMRYEDDLERTGSLNGISFFALGATVTGRVDSLQVTDIPLPPAGVLLLGGLGLIVAVKRTRKAT